MQVSGLTHLGYFGADLQNSLTYSVVARRTVLTEFGRRGEAIQHGSLRVSSVEASRPWRSSCLSKLAMQTCVTTRASCSRRALICSDWNGRSNAVLGNLVEISEESAMVLATAPVPPGKKVGILCGTNQLKGIVLACFHDDVSGFFVEVQFDTGSKSAQQSPGSDHLQKLIGKLPLRAAS